MARGLGFANMAERQKVTQANLLTAFGTEAAQFVRRNVAEYMPGSVTRSRRRAELSADIGGDIDISVLGALLVALDHVKAQRDLNDDDRERPISGRSFLFAFLPIMASELKAEARRAGECAGPQ